MAEIGPEQWQQVSPLLDELLEAAPPARARRLAELRSTHPEVAGLVETLLRRGAEAERDAFLEQGDAPFAVAQEATLAGQTIGAYTLVEAVGQGGMGSVWRAERSDGRFQASVAVKFLNLALLAHGGVERFSREGSMLARLSHPNIARLLDAGVTAGGQPYLVLEYVDGVPIDVWCDSHALNIEARLRLFLKVLGAVAHAHSNLILHRDLKPGNILITADGEVKLLDFGVGKLIEDQSGTAAPTELTRLAGRAFTPDFAAPEQVTQRDVTTATDVYALGVLLYLLLTGHHPTAQRAATQIDRLRAVVEVDPVRPSEAAARTMDADASAIGAARSTTPTKLTRTLRGDLDNIVVKALKKSPSERYPTVTALADDLRRYLGHEPVAARPDTTAYRMTKFVRRYRLAVGAAAAVLVALAFGVVGIAWQAVEAQRQRTDALEQRDRAHALARRNEAVVEFVDMMFTEGLPAGQAAAIQQMLERSETLIDTAFSGQPEQQAELLGVLASYYAALNVPKKQIAVITRARELAQTAADPSLKAQLACSHAGALATIGQREEAVRLLEQWMYAPAIEPTVAASCLQARAVIAQNSVDRQGAVQYTEDALNRLHQMPNPPAKLEAALLGDMGFAQHLAGNNLEADRYYRRAVDRLRSLGRQDSESARRLMLDWGLVKYAMGDFRSGLQMYEDAIEAAQRVGGNEAIPPSILGNQAFGLEQLGRYQEALAVYQRTFQEADRTGFVGAQAYALAGSANVLVSMGDPDKAQAALDRANPLLEGLAESHPAQIRRAVVQARIDAARGDLQAAFKRYTSVIELMTKQGITHPALANAYRQRAEVALPLKQRADALADARKALDLAVKLQGDVPHSDLTGLCWLTLARVLRDSGDAERSRSALQSAEAHLSPTLGAEHPDVRAVERLLAER